ncbi:MAG TPA: protein arginine kinase [Cerasibacillus sp.]|uniref:protein arginine kinase n=1 Tax=Cerasibacillus sp. TaxID=2498711 RepID=UPI002F3F017D
MSYEQFMDQAISPWMLEDGPDHDIVLSSRIRLARNLADHKFPVIAPSEELNDVKNFFEKEYNQASFEGSGPLQFVPVQDLSTIEKMVLVEKHLISPLLTKKFNTAASLISPDEQISIMINEEDHLRIQLYYSGFQLQDALTKAFEVDDWIEDKVNYAFDEKRGYLTSCPTNVGTGMRASVMMHLPALVITKQLNRMIPAINHLGVVVRGIYGEGSEALGHLFQISNQITLGKSENNIIEDLQGVVRQLIEHERHARNKLLKELGTGLEDRIFRSLGALKYSRIMDTKEMATRLSHVRLGVDLELINLPRHILTELTVLTQPGFLQYHTQKTLTPRERDVLRASVIREKLADL